MKDAPLGAPSPSLLARGETGESDDGPTRGLDQTIRVMTLGCLKSESGTSCRPPAHECRASSSASDPMAPMAGPAPGPTGRTALQIAAHRPTDRHRRFAYPTDRQFAPVVPAPRPRAGQDRDRRHI